MVLRKLIEDARELPFDQALAEFEGIAGLLSGNADLRVYREALDRITAGAAELYQLHARLVEMDR